MTATPEAQAGAPADVGAEPEDAPCWMSGTQADAWAAGFNAAQEKAATALQAAEARALAAEAEADRLRSALACVKQQCDTSVYNISPRDHDEAVVRSFQSIADYCARTATVSGEGMG
ncbi:hypothetical protein [Bosea lathyri]|uniref:Uncharacterized protein n=1 Tax=Bosea lathyri TaxID=1036778 RepID=A0A1H6BVB2_9HYPH|nr:hypothetical protein [Bosea lathyri]SEG64572.1 hypothetical protein SAMN04488115_108107 [Bosea lathyri]